MGSYWDFMEIISSDVEFKKKLNPSSIPVIMRSWLLCRQKIWQGNNYFKPYTKEGTILIQLGWS